MSAMEYFLLGVMVSWTPSLIVLAWLVRPALNLDGLRKPIGLLEIPPLNGRDGRPRGRAPFKSCVIERNQRSHDLAVRSRRFRAQRPRALDLARTSRLFIWMATSVNSDRPLPLVTSEIRWRASCALGALC